MAAQPSSSKRLKLTELELSVPNGYCRFYDALKLAQIQNDVLQLPGDVTFLDANLPSKLYVRKAYKDLHSLIHDTYQHHKILVIGSPGTGKSVFALYELYQLLKDGATIVYECLPFSVFMILTAKNLVYAGPRLSRHNCKVEELLGNCQTYYLFDAGSVGNTIPYLVKAKTIVFSSPDKRNYVDYQKHSYPKTLYMPVWTLDELNKVADSSVQAQTRYNVWGGIPRYVLSLNQSTTATDSAVAILTPDRLRALPNKVYTEPVSPRILHINVPSDEAGEPKYECQDFFFASDYVKKKVYNRFTSSAMLEACSYIENLGSYAGFEGQLFEMLAHQKLAAGGTFSVRKLQPNCNVSTRTFTKLDIENLEKVDDLSAYQSRHNVYLRPQPPTFTSLDSIIIESPQSVIGVQITVSSSHPVKTKGLTDVMEKLQCTQQAQFKLFFVVPKKVFDDYKPQSYTGEDGNVLKTQPLQDVEQWVLLLKL